METEVNVEIEMTKSPRHVQKRNTLAWAYEARRKSVTTETALSAYVFSEGDSILNPIRDSESVVRETTSKGSDVHQSNVVNSSAATHEQHQHQTKQNVLPSNMPQHIKVDLTTQQLLKTKGEDIPNAEDGLELALTKQDEMLELIVNPYPESTKTLGGASVFHMLGRDGAKQPTILYGTLGYVLDYLIASHGNIPKVNLTSYFPPQLRRASSTMGVVSTSRWEQKNAVRETIPDWVLRLWDTFLLTYKDACSTEDLAIELVSRFEKATKLKPGASERPFSVSTNANLIRVSFELSNGDIVVARRVSDEEEGVLESSMTSRTAQAVLSWMGLEMANRSNSAIRFNSLLFILHWLRSNSGPIDISQSRPAFDRLLECATTAAGLEDTELSNIARTIIKQLRLISDVCKFDSSSVEQNFGLDFDGKISRQSADSDQQRMREMALCYIARTLPSWVFKSVPIFKRKPENVAEELTLLTYDMVYRHIYSQMLVSESTRQAATPVQDMVRLFRVLSYWPLTCIFEEGLLLPERLKRLIFFVSVAEHLRKVGNFHVLFAIIGSLIQPYAGWLWQNMHDGDKIHKRLSDLKRMMSNNGDYRVYKANLSHFRGRSRIPFLGHTLRHLKALESERSHASNHPQLYNFSRQLARTAAINEFIGGQRHPYIAKQGYTYAVSAGPPGASPFRIHGEGVVTGAKHAQNPPATSVNGTFSQIKLSIGKIDLHRGVLPQVVTGPTHTGSIELTHDEELRLLLVYSLSTTLTEDAIKELSNEARADHDRIVVTSLTAAGFL